jgi:hypothetical protein
VLLSKPDESQRKVVQTSPASKLSGFSSTRKDNGMKRNVDHTDR